MWTRRRALFAVGLTVASGTGYFAWPGSDPTGLFASPKDAARFGAAYLGTFAPGEAPELSTLLSTLFGSANSADQLFAKGPSAVGEWLQKAQAEDFEAGRVVELSGFIMSLTESRLCAVIALY